MHRFLRRPWRWAVAWWASWRLYVFGIWVCVSLILLGVNIGKQIEQHKLKEMIPSDISSDEQIERLVSKVIKEQTGGKSLADFCLAEARDVIEKNCQH